MKSLRQIKNQYELSLLNLYSKKEIEIIFYSLAEIYLNKNKTILKLALDELQDEKEIKHTLFQMALFQLIEGKPYQYVIGNVEFFGCSILVNSNVLIPRPETEELVELILQDNKCNNHNINILDLCSGSGCISISLAKNIKQAKVWGIEIDKNAIEIAKKNAILNHVEVKFIQSDLLSDHIPQFDSNLDIIVSNPPYIKESEKINMHNRVINYEPPIALFVPDQDPLIFYKKIIAFAIKNLDKQGKVYVEINQELGEETKNLFSQSFENVELIKDLSNNFRIIKAEYLK